WGEPALGLCTSLAVLQGPSGVRRLLHRSRQRRGERDGGPAEFALSEVRTGGFVHQRPDLAVRKRALQAVTDLHLEPAFSRRAGHEQEQQAVGALFRVPQLPSTEELDRILCAPPIAGILRPDDGDRALARPFAV